MGRAIASAAVFGFIGKSIGQWLGGNLKNPVAAPMMKWSMGAFWALVAAYSSLKASAIARGEIVAESSAAVTQPPSNIDEAPRATKVKSPLSMVEVETVKEHRKLQATPELERS